MFKPHKCQVCGGNLKKGDFLGFMKTPYFINTAIIGTGIQIEGHIRCLEFINHNIIIPERLRLIQMRSMGKAK